MIKNYMQPHLRALDLATLHFSNFHYKGQLKRPLAGRLTDLFNEVNILNSIAKLPMNLTEPRDSHPYRQQR